MTKATYAWVITKDHIGEPNEPAGTNLNAVGLTGPRNCNMTADEIKSHAERKKFRMRDDDGELYYEGFLVGGDGFEPLDDFGKGNAGATSIEYFENGKWQSL